MKAPSRECIDLAKGNIIMSLLCKLFLMEPSGTPFCVFVGVFWLLGTPRSYFIVFIGSARLTHVIQTDKRQGTTGGRILDCMQVRHGDVGHARFFVCFPLVLSIILG